jgi:cbb3-type cytochrome oxidase maturation protein
MDAGILLLIAGLVLLSGSALAAFAWAARDGQFEGLDGASSVIFADDETMREDSDCFPEAASRAARDGAGRHA